VHPPERINPQAMTPKPTRGGARAGSGRKRRTVPRVPITVRLEPQDAERLRELCRAAGFSQAVWIARAINENLIAECKCQRAIREHGEGGCTEPDYIRHAGCPECGKPWSKFYRPIPRLGPQA
jgi:hypothetical protein